MNPTARAQSRVTLGWNANPDGAIAGYRVYSGGASRTYTKMLDVGNTTTATVSGLARGTTYFFAVTAYDLSGLESAFWGEISYAVPAATSTPVRLNLSFTATGKPVLTGSSQPGYTYVVLASYDLSNWSIMGNAVSDASGLLKFVEQGFQPTLRGIIVCSRLPLKAGALRPGPARLVLPELLFRSGIGVWNRHRLHETPDEP